MNNKIKVIINGISGRMGKINALNVDKSNDMVLCGGVVKNDSKYLGIGIGEVCGISNKNISVVDDLSNIIQNCDVIVDFTNPITTIQTLKKNVGYNKAFVIGTTGLNEEQNNELENYSQEFPIMYAPNYSIGVNVLFKLVEICSQLLNVERDYDLEIIESHHRHKKDSPSGTAKKILDIASTNSGRDIINTINGRNGLIGERDIKDIGMNVIRAGDIVGEHTVMYSNEGERLEITHKAHSREAFSKGVIQAIRFIFKKNNGLYSMQDVLGL